MNSSAGIVWRQNNKAGKVQPEDMKMSFIPALDHGTTGSRALAFGHDGNVRRVAKSFSRWPQNCNWHSSNRSGYMGKQVPPDFECGKM